MTDLEKFVELYKGFGIDLKVEETAGFGDFNGGFHIEMREYDHEKFDGYYGFFTRVEFTKEGKFIKQSFWE